MEQQFWLDSWHEGGFKTSFHRPDVHPYILKHLTPAVLRGKRILVPLCGKSVDMVYFHQHADHVVGVELAEAAVYQFFEEQKIPFVRCGNRFEADGLTLICDNFLNLTQEDVGNIDLIYDRASLVALPNPMRLDYVHKIEELLPVGGQQFVNTLEYAPFRPEPPFSVPQTDVQIYYGLTHRIEHLEAPLVPHHGLMRVWGLAYVKEHGFLLTKTKEVKFKEVKFKEVKFKEVKFKVIWPL